MPRLTTFRDGNYVIMKCYHLRDQNLSLKARGLMSFIWQLPDTWRYSIAGLAKRVGCGREQISTAMTELIAAGYIHRCAQTRTANGKVSEIEYYLYENPKKNPYFHEKIPKNPVAENPTAENPTAESPSQLKYKDINRLNNQKTKEQINKRPFLKPSVADIQQYIDAMGYTLDAEAFADYYESNGWRVGKNPMQDWQATLRGWNKRQKAKAAHAQDTRSDAIALVDNMYNEYGGDQHE